MIEKINEWMGFIQLPRTELGGFPVCPYAKQAILQKSYEISTICVNDIHDVLNNVDIIKNSVTIFIVHDYEQYDIEYLSNFTVNLNTQYKSKDFAILDNDPRVPFSINGVNTSFEHSYLWLIQSLSDLNKKSLDLHKTNYYSYWTQDQLDEVVNWRKS